MAEIYWVETETPGRVAIMPCPWGGEWLDDEIREMSRQRVDVLVSLLEDHEVEELFLKDEPAKCRKAGIAFLSHPIRDHDVPKSGKKTVPFIREIAGRFREGKRVAVHCRAGIGRSATVAACVLLLSGMPQEEVLRRMEKARGFRVPGTPDQFAWIDRFARTQVRPV